MYNKPTLNHKHQIVPKFEKTDANRLADAIEEIARLEKALAESEKRGSELAASYCDGVIGDEYGHPHCRYKVERDAALDSVPGNAAALVRAEGKKYSLNAAGMLDSGAPEHAQTFAIVQLLSEFDDEEAESHWEAIMAYSDFRTSDALFHAAELLAAPVAQAQHSVPEVSGIGRDFAYPRSVVLYLRTEPTDDDLRAIHDGLRSLAAAPGKEGV